MNDEPNKPSELPQYSLRGLFIVVTAIALCTGLLSAGIRYLNHRTALKQAERERLAMVDKDILAAIVKDVEDVCSKLGRVPKDQAELESLLGRPMPVVHDMGYPTPIFYYFKGPNSFYLLYTTWGADDFVYDSTKPNAGWVQHYY